MGGILRSAPHICPPLPADTKLVRNDETRLAFADS